MSKKPDKLDLRTDEIAERDVRDNFQAIEEHLEGQILLGGSWRFFEIEITEANDNFSFPHELGFTPVDIIRIYEQGDLRYRFKFESFDDTNLYVDAAGPIKLRGFIGRYSDNRETNLSPDDFTTVASNEPNEIDGGFPNSIYLLPQSLDGGGA